MPVTSIPIGDADANFNPRPSQWPAAPVAETPIEPHTFEPPEVAPTE